MFGIGYKEKNIRPQNLERPYFYFPAFLLLTLPLSSLPVNKIKNYFICSVQRLLWIYLLARKE
jgi:hypothetical protein